MTAIKFQEVCTVVLKGGLIIKDRVLGFGSNIGDENRGGHPRANLVGF